MEEAKIIDARLSGFSIGQLGREILQTIVHRLVFKICAICGADLPPTEDFAKILAEELIIFLLEFGYSDLTEEEILLSFRLNAKGTRWPGGQDVERISFKGAIFNVDGAAKVLANYMSFRTQLDRRFQNQIDGYE